MKPLALLATPLVARSHRSTRPADPMTVPEGQPTWCLRRTAPRFGVHASRPDSAGTVTLLSPGVPVTLTLTRLDDDGEHWWEVPADAWSPGDRVDVGPLPPGHHVTFACHAPNGGRS
ncbi:MAG: hypothetical protein QM809_11385 [Gordonia sp. (in: high G+C Gram-positive bacteria)]|uniref:hypothetical protein n=1 Tax=Gordonia sp. (in: high G+C Gram-positive bacteria) TaxID=84139 RepID=UPI0039E3C195